MSAASAPVVDNYSCTIFSGLNAIAPSRFKQPFLAVPPASLVLSSPGATSLSNSFEDAMLLLLRDAQFLDPNFH